MRRIWVLFALALSSCLPVTIPPPPPPPPPGAHIVQATIRDAASLDGVPTALVTVTPDGSMAYECPVDPVTARFRCVLQATESAHGDLRVVAAGYYPYIDHVELIGDLDDVLLAPVPPPPPPPPPTPILPRIVIRTARFLGLADGSRWTAIGATDFNLLGKLANGEDIGPVLAQRAALGFNQLRVFTAYDIGVGSVQPIGRLLPAEHPDLYTRLVPALAGMAAQYHLYLELVAFTGPYPFFGSTSDFVNHWNGLCGAARSLTNVTLERVNEYNNGPNLGAPSGLRCDGVLRSNGSAILDDTPFEPVAEYATFHPGTSADGYWQRKVGHDAMDMSTALGVPVTANETKRFPDQDDNCQRAYDAAASASLLSAGATFHSIRGKHSDLWIGQELACAVEWAKGALSIPLECQDAGGYVHRSDLETGNIVRAYQRGADPRCIVRIRE